MGRRKGGSAEETDDGAVVAVPYLPQFTILPIASFYLLHLYAFLIRVDHFAVIIHPLLLLLGIRSGDVP